jgi:hypothetical protein
MNFSFSFQRLWLLLRYDFVQARRNLLLVAAVLVGLHILLAYQNISNHLGQAQPGAVALTCHSLFGVARYVGIIMVTLLLHRKFTNPTTAPGYITLPASTWEKFAALLLDYAAVLLGVLGLEYVCYEATMAFGAYFYADQHLNWVLPFFNGGENLEEFVRLALISAVQIDTEALGMDHAQAAVDTFMTSVWLATLLYFICLNFHFRRNGILKSCLVMLLTYILLTFILIPAAAMWVNDYVIEVGQFDDARFRNEVAPQVYNVMHTLYVLLWCSPILPLGVAARLYWLVRKKQIK